MLSVCNLSIKSRYSIKTAERMKRVFLAYRLLQLILHNVICLMTSIIFVIAKCLKLSSILVAIIFVLRMTSNALMKLYTTRLVIHV